MCRYDTSLFPMVSRNVSYKDERKLAGLPPDCQYSDPEHDATCPY